MTRPPDLLARAAHCYEQTGDYAQAARCHDEAGHPLKAAELWEQAGDPVRAADHWVRGGRPRRAAECLLSARRFEAAAECFERGGDLLAAGWTLVTRTRSYATAEHLFAVAESRTDGERLRRRLGRQLATARAYGESEALLRTLTDVPERIGSLAPARERAEAETWAVTAADHIRRPDLAALVFAASYRAGVTGCADRWQHWAARALGDTTGVPAGPAPPAPPPGPD
ncbi:hypothetical protein [Streptomyces alanosinicus]|uniref:Tetratricopeptide repeat protein n=1 Tax=Streptomyces alanosinicus TaxID=68171 RepID=A0A918YLW0_9ACTN|nr:hypothetical protein [Streptomyces alanosinicus]GHE08714.1 hypothetical protein GCM10010339_58560 [Streptomyces alanosinicus]